MPSKKQYNLVQNDDYDTRIPLHSDEAFHHGITFQAKYIGTSDIPRPNNRVEIVAAMRRIRYEFKAKGIKKRKVTIEVSVDGVKVTLRKKKKKDWLEGNKPLILSHPIYRIFYVSHDSQDLKIFSYIARDASTNVFRCNVFKSNKKNQAMRVVRTVGEAFEVCHKLSQVEKDVVSTNGGASDDLLLHDDDDDEPLDIDLQNSDRGSDKSLELYNGSHGGDHHHINGKDTDSEPIKNGTETNNDPINGELNGQPHQRIAPPPGKLNSRRNMTSSDNGSRSVTHNDVQMLREQLEHQTQQTQAALAQLQLVTEQLSVERAARLEAQARTHQLLVHNKELLDHITALIAHLQDTTDRQQASLPSSLMSTVKQQQQPVCEPTSPFMRDINDSSFHQTNSPDSPLRKNNAGNIFSFNSFNATDQQIQLQQQVMQQLMQLGVSPYNTVNQFQFQQNPYAQSYQNMYNQQLNNNSILQSPTKKKIPPSPLSLRQTFNTPDSFSSTSFNDLYSTGAYSSLANINGETYNNDNKDTAKHFIKPLSQIGTLTATDEDGRVRLIVPVPPRDDDKVIESLVTLKITDEDGNKRVINSPPCITRSTSEKVPNRSELMSQVQRTMWARHTTK